MFIYLFIFLILWPDVSSVRSYKQSWVSSLCKRTSHKTSHIQIDWYELLETSQSNVETRRTEESKSYRQKQQRRRRRRRGQCSSFSAAQSAIKTAALRFPILKMSAAADAVLIATGCCAGAAAARRDTNYHQGKWPSHPQACCSRVPAHCTPSQCSQLAASREARQGFLRPKLPFFRVCGRTERIWNWDLEAKMLDSQ